MISLLLPRRLLILDTLRTYFLKAKLQQVELIQLAGLRQISSPNKAKSCDVR